VDEGDVRPVLGPSCGRQMWGAECCWQGLGHSFGQIGSRARVQNSAIAPKESSTDALPDGLDRSIMPGDVVGLEGTAARQDVTSPVLVLPAYGTVVIGGGVGVSGIRDLPSVGKFFVPQPAPSGFVDLHFEGPRDGGGCPEVVAGMWENVGEGLLPDGGIDSCEVLVGGVQGEGQVVLDVPAEVGSGPPGGGGHHWGGLWAGWWASSGGCGMLPL